MQTERFRGDVAQSLYGVFPGLLGQFTSVTYPRRTGGKRLRSDHVTRSALAVRNNEVWGLGNSGCKLMIFI